MALEEEVAILTVAVNGVTAAVQADTSNRTASVTAAQAAAIDAQNAVIDASDTAAAVAAATLATAVGEYIATATDAADSASLSADLAAIEADVYDTVAAGEAATTTGQLFKAPSPSGNKTIEFRRRTASGSTVIGEVLGPARVAALETLVKTASATGYAVTIADDNDNVLFGLRNDALLTPDNPHYNRTVARVDGLAAAIDPATTTAFALQVSDDAQNVLFGIRKDANLTVDNPDINQMRSKIEVLRAAGAEIVARQNYAVTMEDDEGNVVFGIDRNLEIISPTIKRLEEAIGTGGGSGSAHVIDPLVPDAAYAVVGETTWLYSDGIVLDPTINTVWDIPYGNEYGCPVTPTSTATTRAKLYGFGQDNAQITIADFPVFVTGTPVSPAVPQNFVCLGDSKTDGGGAGFSGAYPNELSRLLTGVGRAVLTGALSPAPLNLSNIYFRGTLGDQTIKHEGRAGWDATKYLTQAGSGTDTGPNGEVTTGKTNAFWNPATQKFDAVYYITQNGFRSVDTAGGVLPDGSNLTFLIWLAWNDAYTQPALGSAAEVGQIIDLIHAGYPNAKCIVMGMNPPPKINFKNYNGSRLVSQRAIWETITKPFTKAYRDVCTSRQNTMFYQLSHLMDANEAHSRVTRKVSSRGTVTFTGNSDYVHENENGIGMVCDALKPLILYNYCR